MKVAYALREESGIQRSGEDYALFLGKHLLEEGELRLGAGILKRNCSVKGEYWRRFHINS